MTEAGVAGGAATAHPYDYHYEPGMPLRPAPPEQMQPSPDWLELRRICSYGGRQVKLVPEPTPLSELLADHFWQGDREMDPVVELAHKIGARAVRQMLNTALDEGIDAVTDPPDELTRLFAQIDRKPAWFDAETFERGRIVFGNASIYGKIAASMLDSIGTAQGFAVTNATGATGKLVRDAVRRQFESLEYFLKVSCPGADDRFSEAFKTNVRVRLMHAQVRYGLRKRWGSEVFAARGNPISNTDMAAGAAVFAFAPLLMDIHVGARISRSDLDAVAHHWSYIAYVFGVTEEILPTSADRAAELMDFVLAGLGGPGPSTWSPELSEALIGFTRRVMTPQKALWLRPLTEGAGMVALATLTHHVAGSPLADQHLVSAPLASRAGKLLRPVVPPVARVVVAAKRVSDRLPGAADRRRRALADGDPFLRKAYKSIGELAQRERVGKSTFEAHDKSRTEDFARP